MIRWINRVIFV